MVGKPAERGPSRGSRIAGQALARELAQAGEDVGVAAGSPVEPGDESGEHTGPVVVSRLRKADGRSLILYSVDRERA